MGTLRAGMSLRWLCLPLLCAAMPSCTHVQRWPESKRALVHVCAHFQHLLDLCAFEYLSVCVCLCVCLSICVCVCVSVCVWLFLLFTSLFTSSFTSLSLSLLTSLSLYLSRDLLTSGQTSKQAHFANVAILNCVYQLFNQRHLIVTGNHCKPVM